jgi:hypothetical protein
MVIWNGQTYWAEKIVARHYQEFLKILEERVFQLGIPDLIYLISLKD